MRRRCRAFNAFWNQCILEWNGAVQCGFCTPGVVMSLLQLWFRVDADLTSAAKLPDGNLCRCTGYVGICASAEEIVELLNDDSEARNALLDHLASLDNLMSDDLECGWLSTPKGKFYVPSSLSRLQKFLASGEKFQLIGGGTDFHFEKKLPVPDATIVDISNLSELRYIKRDGDHIKVGASVMLDQFIRFIGQEIELSAFFDRIFDELKRTFVPRCADADLICGCSFSNNGTRHRPRLWL
ncbi:MAG: 2Fe-2S iron-sulfur cluster-binding protein [Pseudoruegeria sp.]